GLKIANASPTIVDNEIRDNEACFGGAIAVWQGAPLVRHNRMVRNTANCGEYGGAVFLQRGGGTVLEDNVIEGNSVSGSGSGGGGALAVLGEGARHIVGPRNITRGNTAQQRGGIFGSLAKARIADNVIVGNHGARDRDGGGILLEMGSGATADLVNNTIADN